jgi:hypothetical protein
MSTALSAAMPSPKPLFPPLTRDLAVTSLIAGVAADLTWEFWARVITPFIPGVGGPLEPAALVQSVFGLDSRFVAELIHLVVGFVFYPLGYLFVARPLAQAIVPSAGRSGRRASCTASGRCTGPTSASSSRSSPYLPRPISSSAGAICAMA